MNTNSLNGNSNTQKSDDVCILTLYKQHYMDRYDEPLHSDYSCWGYYDGLDVRRIDLDTKSIASHGKELVTGKLGVLPRLWYESSEKVNEMNGCYSSQNLVLFRSMCEGQDNTVDLFWKNNDAMLFFGVAFLQLHQPEKYKEYGRSVENEYVEVKQENGQEWQKICRVLAYCTFDNADMVLLLQSNSLKKMEDCLKEIESNWQVRYLHSVLGVSEKYLNKCYEAGDILATWNDQHCFIDDSVKRMDLRLVSSGDQDLLDLEKSLLEEANKKFKIENYDTMRWAYVSGHENIVLTLEDIDVKSMLVFLLPHGFATHQNATYTKRERPNRTPFPQLYNIETSYIMSADIMSAEELPDKGKAYSEAKESELRSWVQNQIESCKKQFKSARLDLDDSLYAHYLAMLKTLSTLCQHENFGLSRDVYYLIYQSFKLFADKLVEALEKKEQCLDEIKTSLHEYIEAVNSVIYHTIHTDQVFLMIPGYSGVSFSIPIKLYMMYLWFTGCIAEIYSPPENQYRCILVPSSETRPKTKRIQLMKGHESNYLVYVQLSHRTLWFPQSLMFILAHEMGHYIGGDQRCRKIRKEKLVKSIVLQLADKIFEYKTENEDYKEQIDLLKDAYRQEAEQFIDEQMKFVKEQNESYYGDEIQKQIFYACQRLLVDWKEIADVLAEKVIASNNVSILENAYDIYALLDEAKEKAIQLFMRDEIYSMIDAELTIYREIFSDIIPFKLLSNDTASFDMASFEKAWCVSEGMVDCESDLKNIRKKVLLALFGKPCEKVRLNEKEQWVLEYAETCLKWQEQNIYTKENVKTIQNEIHSLYLSFDAHGNEGDPDKKASGFTIPYEKIISDIMKLKKYIDDEQNSSSGADNMGN